MWQAAAVQTRRLQMEQMERAAAETYNQACFAVGRIFCAICAD